MNAVCYKCGEAKTSPLGVCPFCRQKPGDQQDRLVSMVLSSSCVQERKLQEVSRFVKRNKQLPPISKSLLQKAGACLEDEMDGSSSSVSFEFSSSFFDFPQAVEETDQSVTVHIIGRPVVSRIRSSSVAMQKTYHTEQWILGKEISRQDAETSRDAETGCLYVWYRLIGGRWTWKLVSQAIFAQLKSVEDGRAT